MYSNNFVSLKPLKPATLYRLNLLPLQGNVCLSEPKLEIPFRDKKENIFWGVLPVRLGQLSQEWTSVGKFEENFRNTFLPENYAHEDLVSLPSFVLPFELFI